MFNRFSKIKNTAQNYLNQYKTNDPATYAAAQQAVGGLLILDGFIGIDNPLGGKKRPGIFGSIGGIILGIVFLFVPTLIGNMFGVNSMTATTNATVVAVGQPQISKDSDGNQSSTCNATVRYTVNGKEYTQASSMTSSTMCGYVAGQTVQINYDPASPGKWATDVQMMKNILKIFQVAGVIAIITSIITFVIRLLSIIFGWKLLKRGRALAGTLPGGGANIDAIKTEIRQHFTQHLFGGGNGLASAAPAPAATVQPGVPVEPAAPASVAPTVYPPQPVASVAPIVPTQPQVVPVAVQQPAVVAPVDPTQPQNPAS